MGLFCFFVNANQLAQEIGGVYVVVDRGNHRQPERLTGS